MKRHHPMPGKRPDPASRQAKARMSLRARTVRPYRWALAYTGLLALAVLLVLADAFFIPRAGTPVGLSAASTVTPVTAPPAAGSTASGGAATGTANPGRPGSAVGLASRAPIITADSYTDASIRITIDTIQRHNTTVYIADIRLTSPALLRTAFARDTFGRNFREPTSAMASAHGAILAINGDYYGVRDHGFVIRNGILYREIARPSGNDDALLIDSLGGFHLVREREADARALLSDAWQGLTFGPALVEGGKIVVNQRHPVAVAMTASPRAAIGQAGPLHYVFIVSDGRSGTSAGLSLPQLAELFVERCCDVAYNLDGGGSATLWFNGQVVNRPTDGHSSRERSVSDIVYIGYP